MRNQSRSTEPSEDAWYVRLPDGRVFRASSTTVVRRHLHSGRLPPDSWVRRSPDREWVALEWTEEFADLVSTRLMTEGIPGQKPAPRTAGDTPPPRRGFTVASRLDPMRRYTVGIHSLVRELVTALDTALLRKKLLVAALMGLLGGLLVAFLPAGLQPVLTAWPPLPWVLTGLALIFLAGVGGALLTQMTYVELSCLRPATWAESRAGLGRNAVRLILSSLLTAGGVVVLVGFLRWLPQELSVSTPPTRELVVQVTAAVALVLEVLLWPVLVFALLLGPAVVIEESSVPAALARWWRMLRQHLSRILLAEGLAILFGMAVTTPLALPLLIAALGAPTGEPFSAAVRPILIVLAGLAATPLIAYLAVVNVFIYLNLRYEYGPAR